MDTANYLLPTIEEYREIPAFISFRDWVAQRYSYSEAKARFLWAGSSFEVKEWVSSLKHNVTVHTIDF